MCGLLLLYPYYPGGGTCHFLSVSHPAVRCTVGWPRSLRHGSQVLRNPKSLVVHGKPNLVLLDGYWTPSKLDLWSCLHWCTLGFCAGAELGRRQGPGTHHFYCPRWLIKDITSYPKVYRQDIPSYHLASDLCMYIYIYVYLCVCVCSYSYLHWNRFSTE